MNKFFNTIARLNRKVINSPLELKNNHYEINFADFEKKITEENVKKIQKERMAYFAGKFWKEQK